jgi:[acyl-carrier-protein] S-malonyltransferase
MVAGHSLGELSALVANGVLSFEDGLKLVSKRALAMQKSVK